MSLFFTCNGTRVYLKPFGTHGDRLFLAQGASTEQCEGCGDDIIESGILRYRQGKPVAVCESCDSLYLIHDEPKISDSQLDSIVMGKQPFKNR